jgi:antitoxin component YwqK of YwqJK toxin-antitoxin module
MWSIGPEQHWHSCEKCDEQMESAAHSLDDQGLCTVCGAGFYTAEDGTKEARAYDSQGALILHVKYDADGKIISDDRYAYEYDQDGTVLNKKYYRNRVLAHVDLYQPCTDPANGETYLSESIDYYEDVSTIKCIYSEDGRLLTATTYNANNEVYSVERYDYEFDAEGNRTKVTIYVNDELRRVFDDVNDITYDYDGNGEIKLQRSYVYHADGTLEKEVIHIYGKMDHETHYAINDAGDLYVYKTVYFDDTGAVEKEVHYDTNGKEIK